jgi:hypothetical protein
VRLGRRLGDGEMGGKKEGDDECEMATSEEEEEEEEELQVPG